MAVCTSLRRRPRHGEHRRYARCPEDDIATLDLPSSVLRFADVALSALAAAREEIDALNVYPVPDGDTGTNMFLTFESAAREPVC